ncbi:O-antigen ligase family protein [Alkalibacter saccharofermentans]|uniref:O-antigen ligase n=1 Tax=Alkalibacter saccharofermentans DSM 14828 TaxID=1120975 RepID=A0A1M4XW81_9FIRM|nr:O-antigen ligase family protein [Alkalibacter saccharofermentans]SHE97512.1 hypothetical protein SAMN02746064_01599 [Alkalibacter saccharofermentans DSM 14828]
MQLALIMIVMSPYLAFLPVVRMMYKVYKDEMNVSLNPLNVGAGLLFVWALFTGIINRNILSVIGAGGILAFAGMGVYFENTFNTQEKIESLLKALFKISAVAALIGMAEKGASYFVDMTWVSNYFWSPNYIPSAEHYRIYSTFGNPNVTGTWFAMMVLVSIYLFERSVGRDKKICFAGTIAFAAVLIFTGSKGATMGVLAALLVYALFSRNPKTRKVLIGVFVGVLAMAMLSPEVNHALNSRDNLWAQCLVLFTRKPVSGWGLFGIMEHIGNIHGHNIWITLITTLGLMGLALYIWIKTYLFRGLLTLYNEESSLAPLLASVQGLVIVHGLVDFTMMTPQGGVVFFASSALISALTLKNENYPVVAIEKIHIFARKLSQKIIG